MILAAEGQKESAVLNAEAEKAATILRAEAEKERKSRKPKVRRKPSVPSSRLTPTVLKPLRNPERTKR